MKAAAPVSRLVARLNDRRGVAAGTVSSLLVRSAGALTTLIAMPIALHTLGEVRFGTFLLLFGVINWITLGNVGVHSALGRAIASKSLGPGELPDMLGATLLYAGATTLVTAGLVYSGYLFWSTTAGAHLPVPLGEVTAAAVTMIALSALQIVLQVFEGVQIGELKLYVANYVRLAGTVFSFTCLLLLPRWWPTMSVFVIALNGGPLFSAILNALLVMRRVRPRFAHVASEIRKLQAFAVSGLAYLVIGMASLFETHVPVLVLATLHGPVAAIGFGLLIRLLFVMMTGIGMVTAPLWPALLNARADADRHWIRKTLAVSGTLVIGAGAVSFLAVALLGNQIVWWWTGHIMTEGTAFKLLFGIYFLQSAWSHYWSTVLMGLGRERRVALIVIIEGIVMVALGGVLSLVWGATGMIGGMVIGFLAISNWMLPWSAAREFKGGKDMSMPWRRRLVHGLIQCATDFTANLPSQHLRRWGLIVGGLTIGRGSVIYGGAEIRSPWRITIGTASSIGTRATLDGRGGLTIGNRVNLSSEVMLWTMQHDWRARDFAAYTKPIVLADYVWLGPRVIVLPGVTVAEGCVVAAGAVVTRSTEPYGLYAGVPAKRIGERPRDLDYAPGANYMPIV